LKFKIEVTTSAKFLPRVTRITSFPIMFGNTGYTQISITFFIFKLINLYYNYFVFIF
jgi:hypothetical protein